jgi:serine/threonine protein kinase/tetratricopeptide (TPR) repeat protein
MNIHEPDSRPDSDAESLESGSLLEQAEASAAENDDRLLPYLERWDQLCREGQDPTPEMLGVDDPELREAARRRIDDLKRFYGFLKLSSLQNDDLTADHQDSAPQEAGAGSEVPGRVEPPQQIGRYVILDSLGEGGQGQVFRVVHPALGKELVLKLARKSMAGHPEARERFFREGRLLAACDHRGLVRVVDLDFHGGRPFLVMEHVRGLNLEQYTEHRRPRPRDAALLVSELARAIGYLHRRGIIHQDVKPTNVLVDETNQPRIIDFGLARLRHAWAEDPAGSAGGTIAYMSPEQALGREERIGPRTDVFGLGGVLYYLLTGRPVYTGSSRLDVLQQALKGEQVPPRRVNSRVPSALERICQKALAPDPNDRYGTADELESALRRFCWRPRPLAAGAAALAILALLFVALRPRSERAESLSRQSTGAAAATTAHTTATALQVVSLEVMHYRGDRPPKSFGAIGVSSEPVLFDDDVRINVHLNTPAYCYLLALNPNGKVQLCFPSDSGESPSQSAEIIYPLGDLYFPLSDGVGLQAFAVLASRRALPAFDHWEGRRGIHWKAVPANTAGIWGYDGRTYEPLGDNPRAQPRRRAGEPRQFNEFCEYAAAFPGIDAVRAIVFPVADQKTRARSGPDAAKPPWQRVLKGEVAKRATELDQQIVDLEKHGSFAEAIVPAHELLTIRSRVQGDDHWETVNARFREDRCARVAKQPPQTQADLAAAIRSAEEGQKLREAARFADADVVYRQIAEAFRRVLGENDPHTGAKLSERGWTLWALHRYAEAQPLCDLALEIVRKALGEDHPSTANCYLNQALVLDARGLYREAKPQFDRALEISRRVLGEEHVLTANSYRCLAFNLHKQGRYKEAEPLFERALVIRRELLGEDHRDTAESENGIGVNLWAERRFSEAQPWHERALAIRSKVLGEDHPDTAESYNSLAAVLTAQGHLDRARPLFERALAIRRKVFGDDDIKTAESYNNLAACLQARGSIAEAQTLLERALAVRRITLGEDHAETSRSYQNVAAILAAQQRYGEAQPLVERALASRRKALGEDHPDVALGYSAVGANLLALGRHGEAQPFLERALAIRRKVWGENHWETAGAFSDLGANLHGQGRYAEAHLSFERALAIARKALGEEHLMVAHVLTNMASNLYSQRRHDEAVAHLDKALAIQRKALGEDHGDLALTYFNLALNLFGERRHAEAQPLFERTLAIQRKSLGEDHSRTARTYCYAAINLDELGRYAEAEKYWACAAAAYEKFRGRIALTGLDRAIAVGISPSSYLACEMAARGAVTDAWSRFERDLARGLLDDLSSRHARRTRDQDPANERVGAQAALTEFQKRLQDDSGVVLGKAFDLGRIQAGLPNDAALVGWLDLDRGFTPKFVGPKRDHWACVIRRKGGPVWISIAGSAPKQQWTFEDYALPMKVRELLIAGAQAAWQKPLYELAEQRLRPLEPALEPRDGLSRVRHLIVMPSPALAGIPIEALIEARSAGSPRYHVSYAPSGTVFAWLLERRREHGEEPVSRRRLLALGDPVPPLQDQPAQVAAMPPDHGLLVRRVERESSAARSGIQSGDVLLSYGGIKLATVDDLQKQVQAKEKHEANVAILVWRDGKTLGLSVPTGPLDLNLETKPAAEAILARREGDAVFRRARGASFTPLPGTRQEVEAIAALFDSHAIYLGSDASEQRLADLQSQDKLKRYSVIHLATHGKMDDLVPMNSRLLLSQDRLPDPAKVTSLDQAVCDGSLTAGEVAGTWGLDAELVTLSACQTALGRDRGGEGFVGFAQALFLAGARSLVLSLWEVEDRPTSLLMTRFYQNWLGKRPGLNRPMSKVDALRDAKDWLRQLSSAEVDSQLEQISRGSPRPKQGKPAPDHPFEHPHYWAAFVLMGDPN